MQSPPAEGRLKQVDLDLRNADCRRTYPRQRRLTRRPPRFDLKPTENWA
jgi:hypothetical protein